MNSEPIRGRHVHGDKINAALHEVGDKRDVAGKAVKPRNQQHGAALAAFLQRSAQLWPVAYSPPAFDFGELGYELAGLSDVAVNCLALRVQSETAGAATLGRRPSAQRVNKLGSIDRLSAVA